MNVVKAWDTADFPFFFLLLFTLLFMCMIVLLTCVCARACVTLGALGDQEKASDLLELEL